MGTRKCTDDGLLEVGLHDVAFEVADGRHCSGEVWLEWNFVWLVEWWKIVNELRGFGEVVEEEQKRSS
jgi:hypothetical protein